MQIPILCGKIISSASPSTVPWERDRLGRRVTSEPTGFDIWAIAFRRAAELGSPSCTWHVGELARLPNQRSRNL